MKSVNWKGKYRKSITRKKMFQPNNEPLAQKNKGEIDDGSHS